MSMGPLGIVGSVAGSQLPQAKGTDADRASKDVADQTRKTEGSSRAESAEGVGQTDEQEQASDRDADGRRLWEQTAEDSAQADSQTKDAGNDDERRAAQSRDASGQSGNRLDLSG